MKRLGFGTLLLTLAACSPEPERIDLDAFERSVFSQQGEDGVLEKIFKIVPTTTKYAVEFGAWDGILHSNTRNLILNHGWGGFLLEGHPDRARKLEDLYANNPKVTAKQAWVWPGNIEFLFEDAGVPKDLDLLVIDIDSNDYYVWRAIKEYRPKVVLIESNHVFPPPQLAVVDFHPMNYWDGSNFHGASIQSLYDLAKQKGYELIHIMSSGPNSVFVEKRYFDLFGIDDNTPLALWRQSDTPIFSDEKKSLKVNAFEIEKKWILDR